MENLGVENRGRAARDIMAANQRFYDAMERRDFDAMQSIWERTTRAICVHPSRPILRGWDAIANSWQIILSRPVNNQFILTNASITIEGDVAWVVLDEDLVGDDSTGTTASINMFARHGNEWLMVAHHGSRVTRHQIPD